MSEFQKSASDITDQIKTLRRRGMIVKDEARARHYLENISYFRLSAYTRVFYQPGESEHRFLSGTTFDDVLSRYIFDRELRLLLLDAIERLEVALRAQIANTLAEHHGPHGYLDANIFDHRYNHTWLLMELDKASTGRQAETFLRHYRSKYHKAPKQPPIWMAVELLTFKQVSILLQRLKLPADTQRIEAHFGWKMPVLRSWFRSISDLRNVCAHHGRIWNREFGSRPETPKKITAAWPVIPDHIPSGSQTQPQQSINPRRRLYMQIVVIEALMKTVSPNSQWAVRLSSLLDNHPSASRPHMGFPDGWAADPFWRDAISASRAGAAQ